MIRRATLIALIFLLFAYAPAAAEGEGVIQGQVINMTPGGGPVAELTVTLYTYVNNVETATTTASTDSEGRFEFSGLATGSSYQYDLGLRYQEADYYSDLLQFETGETTKFIELDVYDATTSDEAISAHAWYIAIYVEGGGFLVVEDIILANWGDETYIGSAGAEDRQALRFLLPGDARDVEFTYGLMECCTQMSDHSIINSMAFPPGTKEVAFSYGLVYSPPSYLFSRAVDYPTNSLILYVEDVGDIELTSEQLTAAEPIIAQDGTRFLQFVGQDLTAGGDLTFTISVSTIAVSTPTDYQSAFRWVGVALIVLALGFCFSYPMLTRRLPKWGAVSPEARDLLLEIAELDDDFEGGRISEEEYRRLRSQKKARAVELSRPLRRTGDREKE
ncbi:MAG: hypothetical protein ACE5H6_04195 [Dehalococcoidia bacterium]